jgi:hypothetical protein
VKSKKVTFVADKTHFDFSKVKAALAAQGFPKVTLLTGPAPP